MKIDLSKAYDTVDWQFVEVLLRHLCFPARFISWIVTCLKGNHYHILMNGRIQGNFKGKKGLLEGDPMSPLLFVLIMEYLSRHLSFYSESKDFGFHPLCKNFCLTNLCFTDDLILFSKGNLKSVRIVQEAFTKFCNATGLSANKAKSQIFFGEVKDDVKLKILDLVQMEEGYFPLKYLGVNLHPTKWKASDYGVILDKINKNLNCWASRNLTFARRAQLIHSVLLGIRNYWMSIFIIPQKIIAAIEKSCQDFLWGKKGNRSKLHLAYCVATNETQLNLAVKGGNFSATRFYNHHVIENRVDYAGWIRDRLLIPKHRFYLARHDLQNRD
uniref:Reverse transcriptase domain-containing protein n=1 Tax=Cannabis sativa TaxID=3483 RepID=A0A803PJR9_CANSA